MSDTNSDNEPSNYPKWVQKLISELEATRTGRGTIHNLIFRVALALVRTKHDDATIYNILRRSVANCGRPVSERELWQAITNARRTRRPSVNEMMREKPRELPATSDTPALREGLVSTGRSNATRTPKWPGEDISLKESVISEGSLFPSTPVHINTEAIIDLLFPGDQLLCVGRSNYKFHTAAREELRGSLGEMALIVPSPMTARTGLTKEGKVSEHSLDNTGPRHFGVIEFDQGSVDEQKAIFWHLKSEQRLPLVMLVFSGSKSVHGWFDCRGVPETEIETFYRYCVKLGADPATYTPSQFVRMPNGRRDNGARQDVLYFSL